MRRLLRWLLPDADRQAFESEQAELYDARRAREGERAAARGRRADRRALALRLVAERLRSTDRSAPRPPRRGPSEIVGEIWRDLRQSVRSLARSPVLAATIVLTVGLGLGATTAIVTVIRTVVLDPLPYRDPTRLVQIRTENGDHLFPLSVADYQALEAQQTAFEAVAASQSLTVTIARDGHVERDRARAVTPGYFSLLGLRPAMGRVLDGSDAHAGGRSIVLTEPYWRTHFGASAAAVGASVVVDGTPRTVVGILGPSTGPLEEDLALFEVGDCPTPPRKGPFFLTVLGLLRPTVPRATAAGELAAIDRRIFPIWQSSYQDARATWVMTDLKARIVGTTGEPLWLVCVGVLGVLLIACANAAGLLVARALERRRELVVRTALGATRAQIIRTLAAESAVLVTGALVVAAAVVVAALRVVVAYGAPYIPRLREVQVAGPAVWCLTGLAAASVLLIGGLPAWGGSRLGRAGGVELGGRTMSESAGRRRLRRLLVAAEFAVATPLVIAAGLISGSLHALEHVDVGMDGTRVLTASVALPATEYPPAAARAFWDRTAAALLAKPGVTAVAFADSRPPTDASNIDNFDLEAKPTLPGDNQPVCPWIAASADFFKATGVALLRGRLFDSRDFAETAAPVVLVDHAWATRFFASAEVVGRRLHEGGCTTCPWTTVIGEVGTVKYLGLETPDDGTVYSPIADGLRDRFVLVHTAAPAATLAPTLADTVHALDPNLAVSRVATIEDLTSGSIEEPRYLSLLVGAFALTAFVLSVVGIYGVMAHFVARHARDIGIRLALGGAPGQIGRMVVVNGLGVVAAGVAIGLAVAAVGTRLLASVLFGVTPTDLGTFVAVPAIMLTVATIACVLPARRAARVQPAVILHDA